MTAKELIEQAIECLPHQPFLEELIHQRPYLMNDARQYLTQALSALAAEQEEKEKLETNYSKLADWFNKHYIATCNDAYCGNDDCGTCTDVTHALVKILNEQALAGKGEQE